MFIPSDIIISPYLVKKSEISPIIFSNPYYFSGHPKADFNTLLVFLIFEKHKGAQSKWYNYFESISNIEILSDWTESDLSQLQDPLITYHANEQLEVIEKIWTDLQSVFEENPEFFPHGKLLYEYFNWSWRVLMTRALEHEELRLIPMADFINHANQEIIYEDHDKDILYQKSTHPEGPIDYRDFLGSPVKGSGSMDGARYSNRLEEYLASNPSKEALKNLNAIWEVDYLLRNYESSGDEEEILLFGPKKETNEEDEEEEDEEDEGENENENVKIYGNDCIVLVTGPKNPIKQGSQIFQQMKKLSNRDLLLQYGFCMENNKYDSVYLLFWMPSFGRTGIITIQDIQDKAYKNELNSASIQDVTELICLKEKKLNTDILKYYRKNINYSELNMPEPLMKASPSNVDVELTIIDKIIELYNKIEAEKSPLAHDINLLNRTLPARLKFALNYRISQKKIITSQKNMLANLTNILKKVKEGGEIDKHLSEKTIKNIKKTYPLLKYLRSLKTNIKNQPQ